MHFGRITNIIPLPLKTISFLINPGLEFLLISLSYPLFLFFHLHLLYPIPFSPHLLLLFSPPPHHLFLSYFVFLLISSPLHPPPLHPFVFALSTRERLTSSSHLLLQRHVTSHLRSHVCYTMCRVNYQLSRIWQDKHTSFPRNIYRLTVVSKHHREGVTIRKFLRLRINIIQKYILV